MNESNENVILPLDDNVSTTAVTAQAIKVTVRANRFHVAPEFVFHLRLIPERPQIMRPSRTG